jgi:NADPH-dependent glutamate synthase beta subunit-like oxidoreductase
MTTKLRHFSAKTVAIIGAGPTGVAAAKYVIFLLRLGLKIDSLA